MKIFTYDKKGILYVALSSTPKGLLFYYFFYSVAHILGHFSSRFFSSLRRSLIDSVLFSVSKRNTNKGIRKGICNNNQCAKNVPNVGPNIVEPSKSENGVSEQSSKHVMVALLTPHPHPQQLNTLIIFMGRSPKPSTL
jgi:hypothetical protein